MGACLRAPEWGVGGPLDLILPREVTSNQTNLEMEPTAQPGRRPNQARRLQSPRGRPSADSKHIFPLTAGQQWHHMKNASLGDLGTIRVNGLHGPLVFMSWIVS